MKPNQVNLALIHPGHRTRIYQALGNELSAIETPVWAGLIANFARQKGVSVALIDAEAENLTTDQIVTRVQELQPLLTVIVVYGHQPSASTQNMTVAGEICSAIKNRDPQLKIMFVGGHVTALPQRTMEEEECDYVASGEGPYTILELLNALKAGETNLNKVRGLWYRDNNALRSSAAPPLITDLDREMPGIAWDLLPRNSYRAYNWQCLGDMKRKPYAAIYTTLGCPFHCTFCCIQAPFKEGEKALGGKESVNSYRFWSPDFVIREIDKLVNEYGIRNLRFADEMFVLNLKHVHGICDRIIQRGYDLNIWAYARVDTIRGEGTVEKLKAAGINWLALGIESASERVRDDVDKGVKQEDIFKTIEKVRSAGINVIANYIFGLPEDDHDSMQATLDQALELNCEFANFYCGMAYPGSQLYTMALKEGWQLPKKWTGYSQHSVDMLPLPTRHLSAAEVIRFRDHAWQVYFTDPNYLAMITKKFGLETAQHVKEMTSIRLARQYA